MERVPWISIFILKSYFSPVYSEKENSSDSKKKKPLFTQTGRGQMWPMDCDFFFNQWFHQQRTREDKKELRRKERSSLNENVLLGSGIWILGPQATGGVIWVGYGDFSRHIVGEGSTSLGLGPERVWLHPTSVHSVCFEIAVENGISQLHSATCYQCFSHPMNDISGTVSTDKAEK